MGNVIVKGIIHSQAENEVFKLWIMFQGTNEQDHKPQGRDNIKNEASCSLAVSNGKTLWWHAVINMLPNLVLLNIGYVFTINTDGLQFTEWLLKPLTHSYHRNSSNSFG